MAAHLSGGHPSVRRALRGNVRAAVANWTLTPDHTSVTHIFFINTTRAAMRIRKIQYFNEVLEGGALTGGIYITGSGTALASGRLATAASSTIDFNANDNTLNTATLHASNNLNVKPGEVIGIVISGNPGTAFSCVSIDLIPAK